MAVGHQFLQNLALVLCVAALTTVIFQRLRQPVVLGYLLAGLIIGPHVPVPLVADEEMVGTLSELGVILLMFSLGLEFRLRRVFEVAPSVALAVVVEVSLMLWLGFTAGRLLGWSPISSLFVGAAVAISSTTIIAKAFDEQKVSGKLRDLVFGILIFEDLAAVLMLAGLTTLASGRRLSPELVGMTAGRLVAFLVALLGGGMLVVPRLMRAIVRVGRPETVVVASVGLCFAVALLTQAFGYPVALGAFLAGALTAESGESKRVMTLVQPVRDIFAAIFFVAVGMSMNPRLVIEHAGAVAALVAVVVGGKLAGVSLGAFLAGHGVRTSVQAGMSLGQIGEFSFIIASVAAASQVTEPVYAVVVAVSAVTTLLTPWAIKSSGRLAAAADHALPHPLQTFASLYGSWVERLREAPAGGSLWWRLRRLLGFLVLDAALMAAVIVGASLASRPAAALLQSRLGMGVESARLLVLVVAAALTAPFAIGIVQLARRLGRLVAEVALPQGAGGTDLSAAPRRALFVTLELAAVLLVGAPLLAITQPFLPTAQGALALLLVLVVLGMTFWRSATNLEGHVRAGAEVIVEVLAAQAGSRVTAEHSLDAIEKLLPGLGTPIPIRVPGGSPAAGRTLAQLNLRGATGATVLAISRGERGLVVPSADEVLQEGDVLALAGTHEAIRAATSLLTEGLLRHEPPAGAGSGP